MYKGLIFDFGGVVVSNWNAHGEFAAQVARHLHLEPAAAQNVLEAHNADYLEVEKGKLELKDFFLKIWPEFKTQVALNDTLVRELVIGPIQESVQLNENMLALVNGLKLSGFKTALLSNTIPEHIDYYLHYWPKIFEVFDAIMLSYDLADVKPSEAVYEKTLATIGVSAQEAVLVDDTPEFVAAAREYGLTAIKFQGYNELRAQLNEIGIQVP